MMPPLGAMIFAAAGRHPLADVAAAFAGVTGGFSANVMLPSTLDVLLVGISQAALDASKLSPGYTVQLFGNYFFFCSGFAGIGHRGRVGHGGPIVEPRLGRGMASASVARADAGAEARAWWAFTSLFVLGTVMHADRLSVGAAHRGRVACRAHGRRWTAWSCSSRCCSSCPGSRTVSARDGEERQGRGRDDRRRDGLDGLYIVPGVRGRAVREPLRVEQPGTIIAVSGRRGAEERRLVCTAARDVRGVRGDAQPAHHERVGHGRSPRPCSCPCSCCSGSRPRPRQAVFRIGDSCTNIITPMLPYVPFILTVMRKYDPGSAPARRITMMLSPHSTVFIVLWTALLLVFYFAHWPIGLGVQIRWGADAAAAREQQQPRGFVAIAVVAGERCSLEREAARRRGDRRGGAGAQVVEGCRGAIGRRYRRAARRCRRAYGDRPAMPPRRPVAVHAHRALNDRVARAG